MDSTKAKARAKRNKRRAGNSTRQREAAVAQTEARSGERAVRDVRSVGATRRTRNGDREPLSLASEGNGKRLRIGHVGNNEVGLPGVSRQTGRSESESSSQETAPRIGDPVRFYTKRGWHHGEVVGVTYLVKQFGKQKTVKIDAGDVRSEEADRG